MSSLLGIFLLCLCLTPVSAATARMQQDPVVALCEQADARLAAGDAEGAFRLFQDASRKDRKSVRAVLGMGRAMLEVRAGGSRAIRYFTTAVRMAPDDPEVRFLKGMAHVYMSEGDIGRDNAVHAVREFEKVLEMNPSHPDAWYQLARLRREEYEDYAGAIEAYRNQIDANPDHSAARMELLESYALTGEWGLAISTGEKLLARSPDSTRAYPYVAAAYWLNGDEADAARIFDAYFERADTEERDLYFDLGLVLTPEEAATFETLDTEGRRNYRDRYWQVRDPDPKTELNERLLEHYIRVAYSRLEFGEKEWPWDARGTFYVRYGEPDVRMGFGRPYPEDFVDEDPVFTSKRRSFEQDLGLPMATIADRGSGDERSWASRDPERWVYLDRGIDVKFEDPTMSGKFQLLESHSRQLVEEMEKKVPTMSAEEDGISHLAPLNTVVTFRGPDGKSIVEYAFALLPDDFGPFRSFDGAYALLDISVQLYTPEWKPVIGATSPGRRVETMPQVKIRGLPLFVDSTRLTAAPGSYVLTTLLIDPDSGGRASADESVEVPDYSGDGLMMSDLLTAARITEVGEGDAGSRFIRKGLEVLPLPGATLQKDQAFSIYYEIYNLAKDEVGSTDYTVRYQVSEVPENNSLTARLFRGIRDLAGFGPGRAVLSSDFSATGIRSEVPSWFELDMSLAPAGTYQLSVIVTDNVSGATTSNSTYFRTLPKR